MLRILIVAACYLIGTECLYHRIKKRWVDIENVTFTFDCSNKAIGFYADVEFNCQIFHMCDQEGRRIPHLCANDTSFNQEYRICDWENNFDCSEAPNWYYLNELTYATDPPPDVRMIMRITIIIINFKFL